MNDTYELIHGEASETLKSLSRASIDVCVTSPPYWNESTVTRGGDLGRESNVSAYAARLVNIFSHLKNSLKKSGSFWLVLGDDYRNGLHGVPKIVTAKLIEDGWRLAKAYAWDKNHQTIERAYTLNPENSNDYVIQFTLGDSYYETGEPFTKLSLIGSSKHFETSDTLAFPMDLVKPLIRATSPANGVVIDPFVGTGTTLMAARDLGRTSIGIDLSKTELEIARQRLSGELAMTLITKEKGTGTYMSNLEKANRLADRGMFLWGKLLAKETGIENPDAGDEDDNFTALPEVPAEESYASDQRVLAALKQVSHMLEEVLKDPELAGQLEGEEKARLTAIAQWLSRGPKSPMQPSQPQPEHQQGMSRPQPEQPRTNHFPEKLLKAGVDVNLSVKAVIKNPSGHLLLKDAYSDWWDLPGGHVQDGETLDKALIREIGEETGLEVMKAHMRYVKALKLGGEIKPVVIYDVMAKGRVRLSKEHLGYVWANDNEINNFNLGVFKQFFITDPAVAAGRPGRAPNPVDVIVQEEGSELQVQKGPPGPPPHPGLQWNEQSHRWVNPEHSKLIGQMNPTELHAQHAKVATLYHNEIQPDKRARLQSAFQDTHEALQRQGFKQNETHEQALAGMDKGMFSTATADRSFEPLGNMRKGAFGDLDSALKVLQEEHPSAHSVEQKDDGDKVVEDDEGNSWYVTVDGMVYEYWHPNEAEGEV
ncbi:hypothetical protein LCGC14_0264440 [marine sediment metagenome]|uniref:site-specific DNA-methyltransferase (cytosine-N(4)-specific) n=1 Tax=marine sediment metagenome TaxID=412755 RepID=A0A0F9UHQ9_9ZZZZ